MTSEAWVFLAAWLVAMAAWLVTLLAAAAAKADADRRWYIAIDALREDNANLEATVTHLRRQLIRAVDDQPVPLLPTEAAEKAAFDAIVRGWEGA